MAINVLVLGDGVGGIVTANLLRKKARKKGLDLKIRLIGRSPMHTYQPGLLFLPFQRPGYKTLKDIQKPNAGLIASDIEYVCENITGIDTAQRRVTTEHQAFSYDWLVLALGCRTLIDEIDGLAEQWGKRVHGFYTPDSALRLAQALDEFKGGDLVVNVAEMPIKCPVAPIEFACLVEHHLVQRGIRGKTNITLVTPLDGAFTKPVCNAVLSDLLAEKGINVVPNAPLDRVTDKAMYCPDGQEVPFDLMVTTPPHEGSPLIDEAGLGDGLGYGRTHRESLKSTEADRVFLVGDNTNVPTSKAGSVAHFQADVVVDNILLEITGEEAKPHADGHANCFIETGYNKAILVDFNYDIQPIPGKFPLPVVGPMTLLRESYLNHLGKLAFKYVYWHVLLPALPIPFVGSRMSTLGKHKHYLEG